ncbi:3-deoxy-D-manno-octulosonic acid transferase [Cereibacter sphaeroides]|uniref:3-deoxy-D-manno-octulosonic acid transferase n=1 Tax=Cereibacter sphaeroides TaxID=1063 RepID=UPI000191C626|nr:glycosyltransferase N-terminal domain-containing protein [Cereibacter sphaeroides]ACM00569.1 Three-deoxy-D-manno-octulosonic-acid transferase domain protein [Cereibacter sphaeroides KD131]
MTLYRLLLRLLLPGLVLGVLLRRLRGRGVAHELRERLALDAGTGRPIWLHGASNGEITSARWLLEELLTRDPSASLLVTCNNPTARTMVRSWGLPRTDARLAPWDSPGAVHRFLTHWQPQALLLLENELWPERLAGCAARGIPVLAIGARLSESSARCWGRVAPGLLRRMLGAIGWLSAQDAASERRFVAAGLSPERLGPRLLLKAGVRPALPATPPFPAPPRARCLLAASTHEGEEAAVLRAFRSARDLFDLLVIAPRHPQRGPEVLALARTEGVEARLRSRGGTPDAPVYVADTLGEMGLWYGLCGATFIGGTLAPRGGHTPFEPMEAGSALVHGPSIHNFAEVFAALDAAGAALPVSSAEDLGAALARLTPERQQALIAAAHAQPRATDPTPILAALDRLTRPA